MILLTQESMCSTQRLIKYAKTIVTFPIEQGKVYKENLWFCWLKNLCVQYKDLSNILKHSNFSSRTRKSMEREFMILLNQESMCSTQRLIKYVKTMVVFPIEKRKVYKDNLLFCWPKNLCFLHRLIKCAKTTSLDLSLMLKPIRAFDNNI